MHLIAIPVQLQLHVVLGDAVTHLDDAQVLVNDQILAATTLQQVDIVAVAAHQRVIAAAAGQGVVAVAARQLVVAGTAVEPVALVVAVDHVIACAATDAVAGHAAGEHVIAIGAGADEGHALHLPRVPEGAVAELHLQVRDEVVVEEQVVIGAGQADGHLGHAAGVAPVQLQLYISLGQTGCDQDGAHVPVHDAILANALLQAVAVDAIAAIQPVIAAAAVEGIVAITALQEVLACATEQQVVTPASLELVIPRPAVQGGVAPAGFQGVIAAAAEQQVVAFGDQMVIAGTAIEGVGTPWHPAGLAGVQAVIAVTADQAVLGKGALHEVIARAAEAGDDPLEQLRAVQHVAVVEAQDQRVQTLDIPFDVQTVDAAGQRDRELAGLRGVTLWPVTFDAQVIAGDAGAELQGFLFPGGIGAQGVLTEAALQVVGIQVRSTREQVIAGTAVEPVITAAAVEGVVAQPALEGVVAIETVEAVIAGGGKQTVIQCAAGHVLAGRGADVEAEVEGIPVVAADHQIQRLVAAGGPAQQVAAAGAAALGQQVSVAVVQEQQAVAVEAGQLELQALVLLGRDHVPASLCAIGAATQRHAGLDRHGDALTLAEGHFPQFFAVQHAAIGKLQLHGLRRGAAEPALQGDAVDARRAEEGNVQVIEAIAHQLHVLRADAIAELDGRQGLAGIRVEQLGQRLAGERLRLVHIDDVVTIAGIEHIGVAAPFAEHGVEAAAAGQGVTAGLGEEPVVAGTTIQGVARRTLAGIGIARVVVAAVTAGGQGVIVRTAQQQLATALGLQIVIAAAAIQRVAALCGIQAVVAFLTLQQIRTGGRIVEVVIVAAAGHGAAGRFHLCHGVELVAAGAGLIAADYHVIGADAFLGAVELQQCSVAIAAVVVAGQQIAPGIIDGELPVKAGMAVAAELQP